MGNTIVKEPQNVFLFNTFNNTFFGTEYYLTYITLLMQQFLKLIVIMLPLLLLIRCVTLVF